MSNILNRSTRNPLLSPHPQHSWESFAAFNGSVIQQGDELHMFYRAMSTEMEMEGKRFRLSTIGKAKLSADEGLLLDRQLFYSPTEPWERFGSEDPRVTVIGDQTVLFYTALGRFPPDPDSIRVGMLLMDPQFQIINKGLVTPFNAKAMCAFPQKINGKYGVVFSYSTDRPPSRTMLAFANQLEDFWDDKFWKEWWAQEQRDSCFEIPLTRMNTDQVEIGAQPLWTPEGWLLLYAHLRNYGTSAKVVFGIESVLLDFNDPRLLLRRTQDPVLIPEAPEDRDGKVPNVIFPSGADLKGDRLRLFYGASDTHCCVAEGSLQNLLQLMTKDNCPTVKLKRIKNEAIIAPRPGVRWEASGVFNPAVIQLNNEIHLIYRSQSPDGPSALGQVILNKKDFSILHRSDVPIYQARADFEKPRQPYLYSGCEDPRLTQIDQTIYMLYTAFDGQNPPRVAMTHIQVEDFIQKRFTEWSEPVLITEPSVANKDAALFPQKINNEFWFMHRLDPDIVFDHRTDLNFTESHQWLKDRGRIHRRPGFWDELKIGLNTPPIETSQGWLLLYHGISSTDHQYRLGALLLHRNNPTQVLGRSQYPIFEPQLYFEKFGTVNNVVFPCGWVLCDETLHTFYGAADTSIGHAAIPLKILLESFELKK